jgi:very-short-patch-repair endonuclease
MQTRELTRHLRRTSTPAEQKFWQLVRMRKINDEKFLRQYPIVFESDGITRRFIADFCCCDRKLVVELDGPVHEKQKDYDALRTEIIHRFGYRVIRFTNDEIRFEQDRVIDRLKKELERL